MNAEQHEWYWRGYNDAKEAIQSGQMRVWFGLTEDEAFACRGHDYFETYKAIEAKLKEKNT